jgi:hypothetical protein
MKAFRKKIKKTKLYREYVNVLNGILQLSFREADVFSVLLQINSEWGNMVKETGTILSTDIRRALMKETRITKTNLARYITALKNKGLLVESDKGKLIINEIFVPVIIDNKINVTFEIELE